MKKIEVFVQPYNLDALAEALAVEGVVGMSVTECKGFGIQKGFTRGEELQPGQFRFHPKMKVEMVVEADQVEKIIGRIRDSLKTSGIGQGKIFVQPVEDAVRTRTGERGKGAIK
jgi:nitrogen regulatory protein P-II 1